MIDFLYDTLGYDSIVEGQDVRFDRDEAFGTFTQFDQREFFPTEIDWDSQSYKDGAFYGRQNGWIYTPTACQGTGSENCRVHFVLHGCGAWAKNMAQSGYNNLAATNNIIMVYPDVKCWDNEGDIDAENFATNTGIVPLAIKAMVERVTATSSTGGGSSTGDGTTDGSTDGTTDGSTGSSCAQYQALITGARESLESIRDFDRGDADSYIEFDGSSLDTFPTECNLEDAQQALIERMLQLKWIVIRAAVDELRAAGTSWPDIRSRREELLNDNDALLAEAIRLFGVSEEDESSTGDDAVDPCA